MPGTKFPLTAGRKWRIIVAGGQEWRTYPIRFRWSPIIDILGFKDLIATRSAGGISRIIRIFKQTLRPARHKTRLDALPDDEFVSFSDLIVTASPLERARAEPSLQFFSQLMRLMFAQSSLLADEGIAIRGAITIGKVVKSWRQPYGPAVVRAYERDQAKYPRIVIDDLIFKALHGIPHAWHNGERTDRRYLRDLTRRDEKDGMLFVDYLKGLRSEFDGESRTGEMIGADRLRVGRPWLNRTLDVYRAALFSGNVSERYVAAVFRVGGAIHLAHCTGTKRRLDFITN